jgi:hypothetical protein
MKRMLWRSVAVGLVIGLLSSTSVAWAKVKVEKSTDNGVITLAFGPAEQTPEGAGAEAAAAVKRYEPAWNFYSDLNGDGVYEITACGENQSTGQITCKAVNPLTGAVLASVNLLDGSYDLNPYSVVYMDVNGDSKPDAIGCGIRLSDNAVECQIRNFSTGALIHQVIAIPANTIDLQSYNRFYIYMYSPSEWRITYRRFSDRQIYFKILNPLTGTTVVPPIAILNRHYDVGPYTPSYSNIDGVGGNEILTCARNTVTNQFLCEIKNGATGALIKNIPLLTAAYEVDEWRLLDYDKTSSPDELIGCGINVATRQPRCQIKQQDNTIFKSFNVLDPAFVP